jgi:hypothetical protein
MTIVRLPNALFIEESKTSSFLPVLPIPPFSKSC